MIQAVIFDFDGTLYDFAHLPRNLILSRPLDMFLMKAERTARRACKGRDFKTRDALMSEFTRAMSELSKKSHEKIETWYKTRYIQTMIRVLSKKYTARRGTEELFEALHKRGIKIAVFSDYPCVRERMSAIGLGSDVQNTCAVITSAQERGAFKPAPRPFLEIAAELGVKSEQCLVVGDRADTDGKGAELSGMRFLQIESNVPSFETAEFLSQIER